MPLRAALIWCAVGAPIAAAVIATALSPLHAWRDWVYIAAGFAGVAGLCLMLVQPMIAGRWLPGITARNWRRVHGAVGAGLLGLVMAHVAGLWVTSPPDVVDALLFRSPTPFSAWGVGAMWALVAAAGLVLWRRLRPGNPTRWRLVHLALAGMAVVGTVVHAVLIEGAMEPLTKALLCLCVLVALVRISYEVARPLTRRRRASRTIR